MNIIYIIKFLGRNLRFSSPKKDFSKFMKQNYL